MYPPRIASIVADMDDIPGVQPIPDGLTPTGFIFMDEQEEACWWYDFITKQIPRDHWLQPDRRCNEPLS